MLPNLDKLDVWILEKHDLALSKIVRGVEHDMQQLEEVHRNSGLDFETLVDRFGTEMGAVVGDPQRIRLNFFELIERLFGELKHVTEARAASDVISEHVVRVLDVQYGDGHPYIVMELVSDIGVEIARGVRSVELAIDPGVIRRVAALAGRIAFTAYQVAAIPRGRLAGTASDTAAKRRRTVATRKSA